MNDAPELSDRWRRLEELAAIAARSPKKLTGAQWAELAGLYRAVCADASRARAAGVDDGTLQWLDALIARTHNALYRSQPRRLDPLGFALLRFPATLRRHRQYFLIASLLFWGTFAVSFAAAIRSPAFAAALCGQEFLENLRQMHAKVADDGRTLGEAVAGVSFYIQHNTSIAFDAFAAGIFAGFGSLYQLAVQGLALGGAIGFLVGDDKGRNIATFCCGHSAWELTALVVAGTAGLRAGWAWVAPGALTRLGSLRQARGDVAELVLGAALMLLVAACIEGIWSPSRVPAPAKWAFAVVQFGIVAVWLSGWRPPRRSGDRA